MNIIKNQQIRRKWINSLVKNIILLFLFFFVSSFCFAQKNLVKNPSFEKVTNNFATDWYTRGFLEGIDDTSYLIESGECPSGSKYMTIRNNVSNDARAYQFVNVKPHTIYRISGWIKSEITEGDCGAYILILDSDGASQRLLNTNGNWEEVSFYGFTGRYQTRLLVGLRIGAYGQMVTGFGSFDGITVEQVMSPISDNIVSVSSSDPYDQGKVDQYLTMLDDIRYNNRNLYISIFLFIFILIILTGFILYSRFVKDKLPAIDNFVKILFSRYYILLTGLSFIIFFMVFLKHPMVTMTDVQMFFWVGAVAVFGTAVYLYQKKLLTLKNIIVLVMILGVLIRLCYYLYTGPGSPRQPDMAGEWAHGDYITHIARTWTLPPVGHYEASQPPVHYILCAIVYNIGLLVKLDPQVSFQLIQLFIVFISVLCLIMIYKILKHFKCDEKIILAGMGFVCFLPYEIFTSTYLNNDLSSMLFYLIAFYRLLKWVEDKSLKNVIFVALAIAVAALAKRMTMILYPLAGIVFIVEFIRNKAEWKKYLVQALIFLAIAVPLGFSYQVRNYLLFQQDFSYFVPPFSPIQPGNPYNLFFIDIERLLSDPFTSPAIVERNFYLMALIRTALFSTGKWVGIDDMAVIVMFFYLLVLLIFVLYFIFMKKDDLDNLKNNGYIFLVNLAFSFIMHLNMRSTAPYDIMYDIRYMVSSITISLVFFMGHAVVRLSGTKYPVLNFLINGVFWTFCAVSVILVLMVGFY